MAVGIGAALKEGRYAITHYVSNGESGLNLGQKIYTTWAAKDAQNGRFRCIRVYADKATSSQVESKLGIWSTVSDQSSKHPGSRNVLPVLDHFWLTDSQGDSFCTVHPLHGPTLLWVKENSPGPSPWPAKMLTSLYSQVLIGLAFMHEKEVCQGGFDDRDIVIGFPDAESSSEEELTKLFGPPAEQRGVEALNGTGTGPASEPDDVPFTAMITPSSRIFLITDPPKPATSVIQPHLTSAPELVLDHQAGPEADVWSLGALFVGLTGDFPPYAYLFATSANSPEERLLFSRLALGPLPDEYANKMKSKKPESSFDEARLQKMLTPEPEEDEDEANMYPEEGYKALAALVRKMLQYSPSKRVTAAEALEDPFFRS